MYIHVPVCRKYECYIRIKDKEKKFLINLPESEVVAKRFSIEQDLQKSADAVSGI